MVGSTYDEQAIKDSFASCNLDVADDAISTCIAICTEFSLTADELVARWDAYSMNHKVSDAANIDTLQAFRSKIVQEKATKNKENQSSQNLSMSNTSQKRKYPHTTPVIKRDVIKKEGRQDKLEALYNMKSPEGKNNRSFMSPPAPKAQRTNGLFSPSSMQSPEGTTYEKRTDAGKTVTEFNAHLRKELAKDFPVVDDDATNDSSQSVVFDIPFPDRNISSSSNFSYMYTPLYQRAVALDEHITDYEKCVKEKLGIANLQAVGDPSPAQVTVVGRIICEAAEGKLNPSVVQLEGSRKTCGGQRVLLDLSAVPNFQVFPGKIVAVEGIYSDTRGPMSVKRFLEPIPAPMFIKTEEDNKSKKPLRIVTACGPFTTSNNVAYLPLNDLLQVVIDQKPDVLMLVGPFVDASHPQFAQGNVEYDGMMVSFEDLFIFNVVTLLNNVFTTNKQLHVVLVPSLKDAHHPFVYPQPPFQRKKVLEALDLEDKERLHLFSNPCTFSINGILFGISSIDVIMHLSSNEVYRQQKKDPNVHRLLRLSEQLIDQKSFYPIFPPPPSPAAAAASTQQQFESSVPMDLKYLKQIHFECTPDVLICPSMLNRFCGRIKDSVCINPGQLCKGQSGGTFAALTILPSSQTNPNDQVVPDRTLVEIKRI